MKNLVRHNIVIAGACNSGKSSLLNAITRREQAVVSDKAGTTTDTVRTLIEIPGIGSCRFIDTPGLDDSATEIGKRRVAVARRTLSEAALVILTTGFCESVEQEVKKAAAKAGIPVISVATMADIRTSTEHEADVTVSAKTSEGIPELISLISKRLAAQTPAPPLFGNLVSAGDRVVLVMPQDSEAPKDRLILPQSLTIRTLLDLGAVPVCCTPGTYQAALDSLRDTPALVVTDSQVFRQIADATPQDVPLTSFSILMANHKGDLTTFLDGAEKLLGLAGTPAYIVIAQACSHVPDNEDIGTVKLPALLRKKLGDNIRISWCYGNSLPENISQADILIHCGGCMFTRSHIMNRLRILRETGVPVTNYGLAIAACTGILKRISLPQ